MQKKAKPKKELRKVKQSKRPAGRTGRVTKDSTEMMELRKNVDSKKTGTRTTRKQKDVKSPGTPSRSVNKSPRAKKTATAQPGKVGKAFSGAPPPGK